MVCLSYLGNTLQRDQTENVAEFSTSSNCLFIPNSQRRVNCSPLKSTPSLTKEHQQVEPPGGTTPVIITTMTILSLQQFLGLSKACYGNISTSTFILHELALPYFRLCTPYI